jgi:hypothetical protein
MDVLPRLMRRIADVLHDPFPERLIFIREWAFPYLKHVLELYHMVGDHIAKINCDVTSYLAPFHSPA